MSHDYSLRWRLTVSMLLVFILGLGAATLFSLWEMRQGERNESRRLLQEQAREILASSQADADGRLTIELPPALTGVYSGSDPGLAFTLYDASRRPAARSAGLTEPLPYLPPPESRVFGRPQPLGPDGRIALSVRAPQGHTLIVARGRLEQLRLVEMFIDELYEFSTVFIAFAVASFGLIWAIASWSLRPVNRASHQAAMVGPTNLSGRISADGLPREIRPLVDAMNRALERLDSAYGAQRRLTADAAHELRTPLAVLSLRLQRARVESTVDWPAVERDLAQMSRLITQLLELARKESPVRAMTPDALRPTNLSRVVREAAAAVLPLIEAEGRSIEVEAPDVLPIRGLHDDLCDAVRNLLENALVHGEGTIRVSVREDVEDKKRRALIEVADQGSGIPAGLRELVFERFRKAVATSPGAGLGLAIVRHVARAHGGEASVRPGPGGSVWLSLPISGSEEVAPVLRPAPSTDDQRLRQMATNAGLAGATDASL